MVLIATTTNQTTIVAAVIMVSNMVMAGTMVVVHVAKNSATTGSYNNDANWYIDTGATYHFTSDLDRLSVHERYHCKDQVQVANGVVPISRFSSTPHHAASSVKVSPSQWHHRLSHPTLAVVKSISKSNKLGCSFNTISSICDACQRAKSHQLPYDNYVRITSSPLELVHTDVWRSAQVSSGGFKYYVSFLDDYGRSNISNAAVVPLPPMNNIQRPTTTSIDTSETLTGTNFPPSLSPVSQQQEHQATIQTTTDGVVVSPTASIDNAITDVASVIKNDIALNNSTTPGVTTCAHAGKSFPRKLTDGMALIEPKWRTAMEDEFAALQKNNTWVPVP
ncbi:retrotransposon protein, putative, ty1-copia subclass [Tanacetum coccineum]